ncbi:MAG: DPP IV N-terminal domain-containing protein [Planctomycetia bacterium]|nr:DPP IV N-terminal domain-containing protein [Planctomycetia bacterium]
MLLNVNRIKFDRLFLLLILIILSVNDSTLRAQTVDDVTGQTHRSDNNSLAIIAQNSESTLTVERIYGSNDFLAAGLSVHWAKTGNKYSKLVASKDECGGTDIIWEDPISGQTTILVHASELVPTIRDENGKIRNEKPISIAHYDFSNDWSQFLIYTNTKKVWRTHSRGDYWILDKTRNIFRKLGGEEAPESTLQFAKLSPNGQYIAYVRENNLYVEEISTGNIIPLTTDGNDDIINGTFDWVYEEEFEIQDGFRWSPDSKSIAFWRLDTTNEPTFTMIDQVNHFYPKTISFKYPRVGCQNALVQIGIVDVPQTDFQDIKTLPKAKFVAFDDPNEFYIPRMDWKSSQGPTLQKMPRAQNRCELLLINPKTMKPTILLSETDSAWVSVYDPIWLADNNRFIWISERDGFRRFYLTSLSEPNHFVAISPEKMDIIDFVAFDYEKTDSNISSQSNNSSQQSIETGLYFYASPENATERFLFRIDLDGSQFAKVSGASSSESGFHQWQISADSSLAVHNWSSLGVPPSFELVQLDKSNATQIRLIEENNELKEKLEQEKLGKTGFLSFEIEDEETGETFEIDGFYILPPDWNENDPNQKYPLLIYVYGEPAGQTVQNSWGGATYLFHQMLSKRGCIVVSFDNRGTPLPKGRLWRKVIHKKIGQIGRQDQAAALRKLLQNWEFSSKIDADRIGIWGWSAGGTSTLNLLFNYPDLYKVGIAVAPVPDFRYYDTIYQERYTGLIDESPQSYQNGSPYSFAQNLQGKLLLIHGTGDDNCHYQSFERLVDKLIKYGKSFDLMSYAFRSHRISEGEGTTLHLRNLMLRFWETNLLLNRNELPIDSENTCIK